MSYSHDATFDAGPPSPSPASRTSLGGELAFKPPSRPGSSLRRGVRKSAADLGANAASPPPLPRSSTAQQLGNGPLSSADQNALSRSDSTSSMSEDSELEASGTALAPSESPTKPRSSFLRSSLGTGASGTPGRGEMGPPPVPTPRQTDRRARNAAAPAGNGDASLVNELQENLVKEIRRLQGLLLERDGEIRNLRDAKEETEKELGSWKPRALSLIQAEDKLKQENWDLNIAAQQFESDLAAQTTLLKKAENERARANKDLLKTRDQLEAQRVQYESNLEELEKLRSLRETETAVARKEKAGMAREMSDLNALLSAARTEAQRAAERDNLSRSLSRSLLSNDTSRNDDDEFGDAAARRRGGSAVPGSPSAGLDGEASGHSPLGKRLDKDRDLTDLRAKLAMAHKRTGKDSMEKRRLREQNAELRLLLTKAGLSAPSASDVESSGDEAEQWADEPDSPAAGRLSKMRMPKSSTRPNIASRLGLGASRSSSMAFDEEEQDASLEDASDSAARRASLDGMDPAFAGDEYASAPKSRRRGGRKTLMPADLAGKGSPLSRTAYLAGEEADMSSERSFEDGSASGHTEQWGRAPSSRPASVSLEGGNLGAELAGLGDTHTEQPNTLAALLGETSQGALGLQREATPADLAPAAVDHKDTQTEQQPDLLTPLIAERDAAHAELQQRDLQHRAVLAELEQREQQHSTAVAEHAAAISALHLAHSTSLEERDSAHAQVLSARDAQHRRALEERATEHAAALEKRDEAHDAAMTARNESHASELESALAQQAKQHDAAIGEARSRHAQALAAEVAKGAAALTAAEVLHKKLFADQSTEHKRAVDRLGADHAAELAEKDADHAGAIEDLQMSNDAYVRDLETAFNKTLRESEVALKKSRVEVEALRSRLSALEAELARLRAEAKTAAAAAAAASENTAKLNAALTAARDKAAADAAGLRRDLEEARAALAQAERDDSFEDATEMPNDDSKLAAAANGARGLVAPAMDRNGTLSTAGETDDMPQTPADELTDEGVRKVILADLRDTSAQTDDDSWQRYQGAPRAMSSVSSAATLPAAGVVILGSRAGETTQASRDGLPRPESPAPVMYTAGAVNRQHGLAPSGRVSMDSSHSSRYTDAEEAATLTRAAPPVMEVPPPPSMPPPASMPPVEAKRAVKSRPSAASSMLGDAPARPLSPPPPELVATVAQRRLSTLQVPPSSSDGHGRPASRLSSAAMPPPSSYVSPSAPNRQRPSLSSLRTRTMSNENGLPMSAGRASDAASIKSARQSTASRRSHAAALGGAPHLRGASAASFASDATSELSRRMSFASSHASDAGADGAQGGAAGLAPPSTDPMVIHAITQTMIGEYLYKYTRRTMGRSGHSEKRHKRYFWLHPYTNMLYWSMSDPGAQGVREGTSKGAVIEGVRVVPDNNPIPAGLYHLSIVIKTPQRDVKLTAPDRERHEMWLTAFDFLISKRNTASGGAATAAGDTTADFDPDRTISPRKAGHDRSRTSGTVGSKRFLSPARSMASLAGGRPRESAPATESTPRRRGGSIGASSTLTGKRRDTAAHEYLKQWDSVRGRPMSPTASIGGASTSRRSVAGSERRMERGTFEPTTPLDPRLQTAEQMLEEDEGENFDGLENVRACCNGAHDVGDLAHKKYQSQMSARSRRGSVRSRHSRASSVLQPQQAGSSRDSASLRAISPPPHLATPQLGALSLNSPRERMSSSGADGGKAAADAEPSSARTSNSLDWFSSKEEPASGRTTPAGALAGSAPPTTSTFTDRLSKIRAGRPSAGASGPAVR